MSRKRGINFAESRTFRVMDEMLWEWAEAIAQRTPEAVTVTGDSYERTVYEGGKESEDRLVTAHGIATRRPGHSFEPVGYVTRGLEGRPMLTEKIVRSIDRTKPFCGMVLRAEYGLVHGIDHNDTADEKGKLLGAYLGGAAWSGTTYKSRLGEARLSFVTVMVFLLTHGTSTLGLAPDAGRP